jgi:polyribonucleotide nucleotidyltransferase
VLRSYPSTDLVDRVETILTDEQLADLQRHDKEDYGDMYKAFESQVMDAAFEYIADDTKHDFSHASVKQAVNKTIKNYIRRQTIDHGLRIDGRSVDQIRPLYCEVDAVP